MTALQVVLETFGTSVSLRRRADALHVVGGQREVEDVIVFGDVGGVLASRSCVLSVASGKAERVASDHRNRARRAGDGDDAALQVPAQDDLIGGLTQYF